LRTTTPKTNGEYSSLSRNQVAPSLVKQVTAVFAKEVASVHFEVGVAPRGRLRADIVALNMKRHIVICEVKSCWADFSTDNKWKRYLEYSNQFYFVITDALWESHGEKLKEQLKGSGAGIMVCSLRSGVRRVVSASKRRVPPLYKLWLITKLAWIGGQSRARRINS